MTYLKFLTVMNMGRGDIDITIWTCHKVKVISMDFIATLSPQIMTVKS